MAGEPPTEQAPAPSLPGSAVLVTGGASGIGLGLAHALAARGAACVALVDIEEAALGAAVRQLAAAVPGVEVAGLAADVTDRGALDRAVGEAVERFGPLSVACLNAGVFAGGHLWETTDDDWDWVMGVNVRGVVNGVRAVVPRMVDAGVPARIMVTASVAGVVASPVSAPYVVSKFAAVGIAESLHHDLQLSGNTHVSVSVICPAMVATSIGDSVRNRPAELPDATDTPGTAMARIGIEDAMSRGLDPMEGGRNAVSQSFDLNRFYVSTHPVELWERLVGPENDDRLAGRPPRFQMYE
ncbi:MAG: SDR family NAD(P)-dependent oxidoreductase [Microthrixaceae bacterium]